MSFNSFRPLMINGLLPPVIIKETILRQKDLNQWFPFPDSSIGKESAGRRPQFDS